MPSWSGVLRSGVTFALVLALAGCERSADPLAPLASAAEPRLGLAPAAPFGFTVVRGEDGAGEVRQVIDGSGGLLLLDEHYLVVPRGAVSGPTLFRMVKVDDGTIHVDLTATSPGSSIENDVGASGFARPLTLGLSYRRADVPGRVSQLSIAWLRPDGQLESMPSRVDSAKQMVVAVIQHFSGYILVTNLLEVEAE